MKTKNGGMMDKIDLHNYIRLYLEQSLEVEEDQATFLIGYILNNSVADKELRQQIGRELLEAIDARDGELMESKDAENIVREVCKMYEEQRQV